MRCCSCGRKFTDKLEPCELFKHEGLKKAGIGQWCVECYKDVPIQIKVDLKEHADRHIRDKELRKHGKFRDIDNSKVGFGDEYMVVKSNPSPEIRRSVS